MSTTPPSFVDPKAVARYFVRLHPERDRWKQENRFYYESIENLCRFHVSPGSAVLLKIYAIAARKIKVV